MAPQEAHHLLRDDLAFAFSAAACNLIRLPKLLAEPEVA